MAPKDPQLQALEILNLRQSAQLDRMQMQLEKALRHIQQLEALLRKKDPDKLPPEPEPGPGPAANQPEIHPDDPAPRPRPEPKKKGKFGRNAMEAALERRPERHLPGSCPCCGHAVFTELRVESTEFYDYQPAKMVVRVVERVVGRCNRCQHPSLAPFPKDLIPRLRASPPLIALYIYQKFALHLPWHRIDQELLRLGVRILETTRDSWLIWAATQLALLVLPLKKEQFAVKLLHADATGVKVVQAEGGTELGQMSVYCNEVATIYDFHPSKDGYHQRRFLGLEYEGEKIPDPVPPRFEGHLVADAASNANQNFVPGSGIIECGCNNHARVKFEKAEENNRRIASEALGFYKLLYAVEREATAQKMDPAQRLALRQEKSAPIVAQFRLWLEHHHRRYPPKESIAKALNYLWNHWTALMRFLEKGWIPLDNNFAERQLRAVAVGRRNYLFTGSEEAGGRLAVFYTFVKTCAQHKVDVQEWLSFVLPRIGETRPSQLGELLPHRWKERRQERIAA